MTTSDGNNKAFNACRAYIPNAQKWVFTILFQHCLPLFFGSLICNRNNLLLTDGCSNEYVSFISNIGKNCVYPNSCHGLCYFHIAIQGWIKNVQTNVTNKVKKMFMLHHVWMYANYG